MHCTYALEAERQQDVQKLNLPDRHEPASKVHPHAATDEAVPEGPVDHHRLVLVPLLMLWSRFDHPSGKCCYQTCRGMRLFGVSRGV